MTKPKPDAAELLASYARSVGITMTDEDEKWLADYARRAIRAEVRKAIKAERAKRAPVDLSRKSVKEQHATILATLRAKRSKR